jgi:hypothetical protein
MSPGVGPVLLAMLSAAPPEGEPGRGLVGLSNGGGAIDLKQVSRHNVALKGGVAPDQAYILKLLADVLAGRLHPSPLLDLEAIAMSSRNASGGPLARCDRFFSRTVMMPPMK